MKYSHLLGVLALAAALTVFGCTKKQEPPAPEPAEAEDPVVEVEEEVVEVEVAEPVKAEIGAEAASLDGLTYIKGGPVKFEDGKVYVVEFWATWCPPCRTSIPHLTEVQKQFKDKEVTVLGISNEEDLEKVKAFVTEQGEKMDYVVAADPDRAVAAGYMEAYQQRGIPTAFIVDGKGRVAWVGHPMAGLEEVLEQVIAGTFDPAAYAKAQAEEEAARKKLADQFREYIVAVSNGDRIEQTRPLAEKLIAVDNAQMLNALAWNILSKPDVDEAGRDLETALKAAEKANTLTDGQNPAVLDTYAKALFENGKLAEAVATQQKAVEQIKDERMRPAFQKHLKEYQDALAAPQTP